MPEKENTANLFIKTLKWVVEKLNNLKIPYMITGGSAVGFWGRIRTTMDIDIVIKINESQIKKIFSKFKEEAYISKDDILSALTKKTMFNVIYDKTSFKVDFIPLKEENAYEKESFSRKLEIDFENLKLWVISPEDLIISKLQWLKMAGGSERQMADCKSIVLVNKKIDVAYIDKWTQSMGINDLWKKGNLKK